MGTHSHPHTPYTICKHPLTHHATYTTHQVNTSEHFTTHYLHALQASPKEHTYTLRIHQTFFFRPHLTLSYTPAPLPLTPQRNLSRERTGYTFPGYAVDTTLHFP